MTNLINLSDEEKALAIALLPPQKFEFIMSVIESLCEPSAGDNANHPQNRQLPNGDFENDIVNWKRSQPFSYTHLIEQTSILKAAGYKLLPMDGINRECCPQCGNQNLVNMIYACRNQPNDTVYFELCLSCHTSWKITFIRAFEVGV